MVIGSLLMTLAVLGFVIYRLVRKAQNDPRLPSGKPGGGGDGPKKL